MIGVPYQKSGHTHVDCLTDSFPGEYGWVQEFTRLKKEVASNV